MQGFELQQERNSNASKGQNTVQQKQELIVSLKQSEQVRNQKNKEESIKDAQLGLNQLRKIIKAMQLIAQKEQVESSKNLYEKKIIELKERLKNREEEKEVNKNAFSEESNVFKTESAGLNTSQIDEAIKKKIRETMLTEKSNIKWQDIAGLENAKHILKEYLLIPIKFKQFFVGSYRPSRGILLYGAPGTGKTYLARACASQIEATFFSVSPCNLFNKYVGDSEKMVKALFNQAKQRKPSIIFIDDLESIFTQSEYENNSLRVLKTQILIQIQSLSHGSGVVVLASTNVPWKLDRRIFRRLQRKIYIPLPQCQARLNIIKRSIKEMNSCAHTIAQDDLKEFARQTDGYTCSDIICMIRDASFEPIRRLQKAKKFRKLENGKWTPCGDEQEGESRTWMDFKDPSEMEMEAVTRMDFVNALKRCRPSVDQKQLLQFQQFTKTYGQEE